MDYTQSNMLWAVVLAVTSLFVFTGCDNDSSPVDPGFEDPEMDTFGYAFNEGQLLGDPDTAYRGTHDRTLSAEISVEEMDDGNAAVTVVLENTISGEAYPVHVHDMADPSTTPNNTPYNETPNGDVFAQVLEGTGGSVSATNETDIAYQEIVSDYEAFFVVHDPLQDLSTVDLTTYLILGVFGESLEEGASSLRSASYDYAFNEGQLLGAPETAYDGTQGNHPRNLNAVLEITERPTGLATVTVTLENTLDGEEYAVHAHDMADPDTTPNNTPYNETPNGDVFAQLIVGNGGSATGSFETDISYLELINDYEAFFVVHDPTQDLSTVDLTTYLILGVFGESLEASDPNLRAVTITMGNDGSNAYVATSVEGAPQEDVVALNESNPTVMLQEGMRYKFVIENGGAHPFGIDDGAGTTLLNHDGSGSFSDDAAVNLITDDEGGLSFNLTADLSDALVAYFCNFHGPMRGELAIIE